MDSRSVEEAMRYFGVDDIQELQRIVLEHDIDVEVDDDGALVSIIGDLKEPLFEEHHRQVGHRPDDPEQMKKAHANQQRRETLARQRREARRELLKARHTKAVKKVAKGSRKRNLLRRKGK